jgi:predicted cobalt transporter CbtA
MTIADRIQDTSSDLAFRNCDGLILFGYAAFAMLALAAAIYLGPAVPGVAGNDIVTVAVNAVI